MGTNETEPEYLDKTITLRELINLCAGYDKTNNRHPESEYEGFAVLNHILSELVGRDETYLVFDHDDPETDKALQDDPLVNMFRKVLGDKT